MNKAPFSQSKAVEIATSSNQIEGYQPVKNKVILKQVKECLSKEKIKNDINELVLKIPKDYKAKEKITSVVGLEEW